MKKYILAIMSVLTIALFTFVLTGTSFESVDMLMRPPKNEGQNSEIQAAFEASINDKYSLRSPLSGEYKSSFILVDFNGDKKDEVVVFYSSSGAPDVARMNVICFINGEWRSVADFESSHKQIHKVDFADINKDGMLEIIVGWSVSDTELINTLNVYSIASDNGELTINKIFEQNYTEFSLCDINNDYKTDILLFDKLHSDNVSIRAVYYDFVGKHVYEAGDFFIDATISSVYSVSVDKNESDGNTRIYVDGYRFDSGMTTEMFYWNKKEKRFILPVYEDNASLSTLATRNTVITCKDINDDDIVEIPFEEYINDSEVVLKNKSLPKEQSIIKWLRYDEEGLSPVYYEIFNLKNSYSLKIKNDWYGNFTVKTEPEKGLMTFYRVDGTDNDFTDFDEKQREDDDLFSFGFDDDNDDNALFSILCSSESNGDFYDLSGYKHLKTDNGYSYFCYIFKEGKKSGITKDTLKKILVT